MIITLLTLFFFFFPFQAALSPPYSSFVLAHLQEITTDCVESLVQVKIRNIYCPYGPLLVKEENQLGLA